MPLCTRSHQHHSIEAQHTLLSNIPQRRGTSKHLDLTSRIMQRFSSNVVLVALVCGLLIPTAQSLPHNLELDSRAISQGVYKYGQNNIRPELQRSSRLNEGRDICELLDLYDTSLSASSEISLSRDAVGILVESLKRLCRSKQSTKSRLSMTSEMLNSNDNEPMTDKVTWQDYDVMWPTYLPLKLVQKRRWGDTIGACIQSNCSSFSGATRVGCIVQRCQRKRDYGHF